LYGTYDKPGRNARPAETKLSVDYFDEEVDVQAKNARQHHGLTKTMTTTTSTKTRRAVLRLLLTHLPTKRLNR
jgi:hypothetical protein